MNLLYCSLKSSDQILTKTLFYVFIFSCVYVYGQEIEGYTYDESGRVPGVKISNLTQDRVEVSNPNGYFRVEAAVGDTVHFTSVAYDIYELVVEEKHLEKKIVVELSISTLDEVRIMSYRARNTAIEDLDTQLAGQIQKDIKRHPNLYRPSKGNIGNIFQSIFDLFKKDSKPEIATPRFLSFEDFEVLFLSDEFFNAEFLTGELNIPDGKYELFYEFLALQQLEYNYLQPSYKLDLIDELYKFGREFNNRSYTQDVNSN
jgi:hypothetical protein